MNAVTDVARGPAADILTLTAGEICDCLRSSFNEAFYIEHYPDISPESGGPLEHYALVGWRDGRDPCDWFSTQRYLQDNMDVAQKGVNPLLHFLEYGQREGRHIWPSCDKSAVTAQPPSPRDETREFSSAEICDYLRPVFDNKFYIDHYPDMADGLVDPLEHYAFFGWKENRDPCEWFSTRHYLARHADVQQKNFNPLLHYVLYGQKEGRSIWPANFSGTLELEVDPAATFVTDLDLRELTRLPPRALRQQRSALKPARLVVHWLIPDFSPGSGGHMTIFRIVRWLEIMGHECTVWITIPFQHRDSRDAYDDIIKNFQTIRARVAFVSEGFDTARGDVVIATGWQTVAQALNATNFRQRFYFVQDYEVNFHPMGSSALIAYWTYTQELACICASPWLANMLTQRFGRWTRHFFLAYDRDIYFPLETSKRRSKLEQRPGSRIVLYARVSTARRAVELALLALEQLAKSGVKFHVDLFGEMNTWSSAPFPCRSHGILNAGDLAELYRDADIGICFSTTNYSIVPQEMMACGLPVVEIDGDSTRTTFPEDVVTFTGPHPLRIAADINALLKDQPRRDTQANAALLWTSQFDWEKSAKAVESALLERLLSEPASPSADAPKPIVARRPIKATVCIPVFNGGKSLLRLIKHLRSQRTPWLFEIVIVDSGSTDGSMQKLGASAGTPLSLRIATIPQHEFQHGRTRNLCANMAKGEFVAFLTQDALPTDDFWLYNLVTTLEHFPHAAGAFGRHIAMPTASPFMKHELITHFARLTQQPLALSRDTDIDRWNSGDQEWRQILHFFSDNNSCLRRSVWQRVPYPELDYGEDQVWADNIIRLGYEKVFAPSATVYHSHDHTPDETRARAAIEAFFFADAFGYQSYDDLRDFDEQLAAMQHSDMRWARGNGVSQAALTRQLTLNEAKLLGRRDGVRRALNAA